MEKTKQERCKFCQRFMGKRHNESHCVVGGWEDDIVKNVTELNKRQVKKKRKKYIGGTKWRFSDIRKKRNLIEITENFVSVGNALGNEVIKISGG